MDNRFQRMLITVLCSYSGYIVAAHDVRFANQSARPTSPTTDADLSDSSESTCAAFDYSSDGAKFTKVRLNMSLPAGEVALMISGHNMRCDASATDLYLLPLVAEDSNRWHGLFKRCHLIKDTNSNPHRCFYNCECPAVGCTDVQLTHMPKPTELRGWQLCLVAMAVNLTGLPGLTCAASSEYNANHACDKAYSGDLKPGSNNEWAALQVHGIWIRLDFNQRVLVTNITLWPRCEMQHQFSRMEIETSPTSNVTVARRCNGSGSWSNCAGIGAESYPISANPSDYVKLTGYDACTNTQAYPHGGIREITVQGFKL